MAEFNVGDVVKRTFPPYISGVKIIAEEIHGDSTYYLLDRKPLPLWAPECTIKLDHRESPKPVCGECKGSGLITLLTSTVPCYCRMDFTEKIDGANVSYSSTSGIQKRDAWRKCDRQYVLGVGIAR